MMNGNSVYFATFIKHSPCQGCIIGSEEFAASSYIHHCYDFMSQVLQMGTKGISLEIIGYLPQTVICATM